jgi:hypothetical protein
MFEYAFTRAKTFNRISANLKKEITIKQKYDKALTVVRQDIEKAMASEEEDDFNHEPHLPSFTEMDLFHLAQLKSQVVERFFENGDLPNHRFKIDS